MVTRGSKLLRLFRYRNRWKICLVLNLTSSLHIWWIIHQTRKQFFLIHLKTSISTFWSIYVLNMKNHSFLLKMKMKSRSLLKTILKQIDLDNKLSIGGKMLRLKLLKKWSIGSWLSTKIKCLMCLNAMQRKLEPQIRSFSINFLTFSLMFLISAIWSSATIQSIWKDMLMEQLLTNLGRNLKDICGGTYMTTQQRNRMVQS